MQIWTPLLKVSVSDVYLNEYICHTCKREPMHIYIAVPVVIISSRSHDDALEDKLKVGELREYHVCELGAP